MAVAVTVEVAVAVVVPQGQRHVANVMANHTPHLFIETSSFPASWIHHVFRDSDLGIRIQDTLCCVLGAHFAMICFCRVQGIYDQGHLSWFGKFRYLCSNRSASIIEHCNRNLFVFKYESDFPRV